RKKIAQASKRDATTMRMISLLGMIFLLGASIASIFSTIFFDFKDTPGLASVVFPRFWLFWAITILVTGIITGDWFTWE
ncbi:hypothetical protein BGZ60DRAFT_385581, partial [Tricladium varicosporioides]